MNWHTATIVRGIESTPFRTGQTVFVNRTVTGFVRVVVAGGTSTALVRLDEARRRVRVVRDEAGRPVPAPRPVQLDIAWDKREARRFMPGGKISRLVA
ncbi:MAG: hypothetical protein JWO31_1973 [Phycisphaerales bacterium]|nr:hypothetical protein [Phycisphaerales bacterium]